LTEFPIYEGNIARMPLQKGWRMHGCHVKLEWPCLCLQNGGFFLLHVSHTYVVEWQLTKQLKMIK